MREDLINGILYNIQQKKIDFIWR